MFMNIIIKLIGHIVEEDNKKYIYEFKINNCKIVSYQNIKEYLCSLGLDEVWLDQMSLTCDCKNLKAYTIENTTDKDKKVYIYTSSYQVRNELINIFTTYGHKVQINTDLNCFSDNQSLSTKNEQSNETIKLPNITIDTTNNDNNDDDNNNDTNEDNNDYYVQEYNSHLQESLESTSQENNTEESIEEYDYTKINQQTKQIFEDADFKNLIKIYINKPELFKIFYKYISSGNIIINDNINNNISDGDINESTEFINNLNFGFHNDDIRSALLKTNNHINLSLRYLLFNSLK